MWYSDGRIARVGISKLYNLSATGMSPSLLCCVRCPAATVNVHQSVVVCPCIAAAEFRSFRDALAIVLWLRIKDGLKSVPLRRAKAAASSESAVRDADDWRLIHTLGKTFLLAYTSYYEDTKEEPLPGDDPLSPDSPFTSPSSAGAGGPAKKKRGQKRPLETQTCTQEKDGRQVIPETTSSTKSRCSTRST